MTVAWQGSPLRPKLLIIAFTAVLVTLPCAVRAEDPITVDYGAVRRNNPMPSDQQVADELKRMRPEIDRALAAPPAKPPALPEPAKPPKLPDTPAAPRQIDIPPHLLAKPKTFAGTLDPSTLAKAYETATNPTPNAGDFEFLVFVSFSIPDHELKKLIENAAEANAVVVFRGPVDEEDTSLRKFMAKAKALGVKRAKDIQINPPAFTKYQISQVPAYVLAQVAESRKELSGCAPAGSFASLTGSISPEFALNVFKSRGSKEIATAAQGLLSKMQSRREPQ